MAKAIDILQSVPLFSCLTDDELETLALKLGVRKYPKGSVVINEGDESRSLYIIERGRVWISKVHGDGREVVLATLSAGDYFGEMALIDNRPRSANAVTKEATTLYVLHRSDFQELMLVNPAFAVNLLRGLSTRLRAASNNIESLALMDVYGRVASLLLRKAKKNGDDRDVIEESLTHREIATMVGSSREMVSKIMKDLARGGYITPDKGCIYINRSLPPGW